MQNKIRITYYSVLGMLLGLSLPLGKALAQQACPTGYHQDSSGVCLPDSKGGGPAGWNTLTQVITKVIEYALYFAGIVAILFIIYGGYLTITAAGNAEQAEKGRKALTNAIIGIVLVGLAFMIVRVVTSAVVNGPTA